MSESEDDFDRIANQPNISNDPNPAHRQSLRRQMFSVFRETDPKSFGTVTTRQNVKSRIMQGVATIIAVAVALIIALMYFAHNFQSNTPITEITNAGERARDSARGPVSELAALNIKLPKQMFVGTEKDIRVPNLKPLATSRPPFLAPVGTKNVAFEKPVTSTDDFPIIGELEMITDGDKEAADGSFVELGPSRQSITIDLEAEHIIYAIVFWHWHQRGRVYRDVVVQVSNNPDFIDSETLFNNDIDNSFGLGVGGDMHYVETYLGKLVDAKGARAQYVRLYSNGNNENDVNHYIEVEIYGMPVP